ncbi:Bug family tripartite tricarboxylate transporter substrate binding protein [Achromobacter sp.]|uniref:Bug family tripartite tricarboxylate transporter substrate binding protein n=1 Tax=Achromobacter sp. TaxID=134375 RepID=UPI003C744FCC
MFPQRYCHKIFARISLCAAMASMALAAHATEAYPSGPIKLIVPYAAGASTDALARIVGKEMSETLKQPVVVENKAGSGGVLAADFVKRQKPDGYTFMLTTDGILSVNPAMYQSLAYDPLKDFSPLSVAVAVPLVLAVTLDSPFKTAEDLIAYARANPGKLSYGSAGVGSSQHMAGALLADLADVNITHVPYRGGAPAMVDLLGGHIDMMFVQTASAKELTEKGKLRLLGIGSPKRSDILPDVRTFNEIGLKGYDSDTWYGFNMPAQADPAVVKTLNAAIVKALQQHRASLEAQGYTIVASSPEAMQKSVELNIPKWRELAKKAGVYQQQ